MVTDTMIVSIEVELESTRALPIGTKNFDFRWP